MGEGLLGPSQKGSASTQAVTWRSRPRDHSNAAYNFQVTLNGIMRAGGIGGSVADATRGPP